MNNLNDFRKFWWIKIFLRGWGAPVGGRQTEVCAPGAKNPRYASATDQFTNTYAGFRVLKWVFKRLQISNIPLGLGLGLGLSLGLGLWVGLRLGLG